MNKGTLVASATLSALLFCIVTLAQDPIQDINPKLHPNLAAAQIHVVQANNDIIMAQKDNTYDMKGHAEKARQHWSK